MKNKELIEAALKRAESEKLQNDPGQYMKTLGEIYRLDTELKVSMNNHSELLKACTDLGIKADEIIRKSKLSRLRNRFDFVNVRENIIRNDSREGLEFLVQPFLNLRIDKRFDLSKVEDLLSYRPEQKEVVEKVVKEPQVDIVFDDEIDEKRFVENSRTLFHILLQMVKDREEFSLSDYNDRVCDILSANVFKNGDYYAFLVHLCGKKDYFFTESEADRETFLDEIIKEFVTEDKFAEFLGMRFELTLAGGETAELVLNDYATVTDFVIRRV